MCIIFILHVYYYESIEYKCLQVSHTPQIAAPPANEDSNDAPTCYGMLSVDAGGHEKLVLAEGSTSGRFSVFLSAALCSDRSSFSVVCTPSRDTPHVSITPSSVSLPLTVRRVRCLV